MYVYGLARGPDALPLPLEVGLHRAELLPDLLRQQLVDAPHLVLVPVLLALLQLLCFHLLHY